MLIIMRDRMSVAAFIGVSQFASAPPSSLFSVTLWLRLINHLRQPLLCWQAGVLTVIPVIHHAIQHPRMHSPANYLVGLI